LERGAGGDPGPKPETDEKDSEVQKLKEQNETLQKRSDNLEQTLKSTAEQR
jgi:hypothetical protein